MAILTNELEQYSINDLKIGGTVQISLSGKKTLHKYLDCKPDGRYESHAFMAHQKIGRFNTYHLIFADKAHIKFNEEGNIVLDENHVIKRIIGEGSAEYKRLKTIDDKFC